MRDILRFRGCTSVLPSFRVAILPTFRVAILPTAFFGKASVLPTAFLYTS